MDVSRFDYHLPPERIAQSPARPRDSSRLLVLHRDSGAMEHRIFRDLPEYLRPGDVLVVNDTRVLPARLIGRRRGSGGKVELLLLRRLEGERWEVLCRPARRLRAGAEVEFGDPPLLTARLDGGQGGDGGLRVAEFFYSPEIGPFEAVLDRLGQMPLPPYISAKLQDPSDYQTVYARVAGSAAAPTAGLHFTPELMDTLRVMGVQILPVTLHVGLGTFRPVQAERVEEHRMHSEWYHVPQETAQAIAAARQAGRRVVAAGTTACRALESAACALEAAAGAAGGVIAAGSGWTDIFIYPGYTFRVIDGLITNFHLPRSTLLMLVSAFAGTDRVLAAYAEAVRLEYRFYSFGDAMLII